MVVVGEVFNKITLKIETKGASTVEHVMKGIWWALLFAYQWRTQDHCRSRFIWDHQVGEPRTSH